MHSAFVSAIRSAEENVAAVASGAVRRLAGVFKGRRPYLESMTCYQRRYWPDTEGRRKAPSMMRRRFNTSDRLVRCQPLVSDSEASHFANKCEQVWREMSRKTARRRYFTTGDIADYTGLTQGQILKTARDPNSWLALFVVCAGKGEHCRFVDPTGWLLKLWCGFRRVKRSFPSATRNQVFKAFRIIGLEKGKPRRRLLT